ncbi:MAG: hypothetical protein GX781_02780 [Clostridiales bacterium]|nr:hypothetical protein [Clostridiales bacterium]
MTKRRNRPLFAPQKKKHPGCLMGFLIFLFSLLLVFGLNAVNNSYVTLLKQQISVPAMAQSYEGFSILHLSDLHGASFGEKQERLFSQIRLEKYQAVCLTGDMLGKSKNVQPLLDLLDRLPDDIPIFIIAGDDDPEPLNRLSDKSDVKAGYIAKAEEKGAIYLDSPQKINYQGKNIWFSPAQLFLTDLKAASFALLEHKSELETRALAETLTAQEQSSLYGVEYQLGILAKLDEARLEMEPDDLYVLLSHFPLDATDVASLHTGERLDRKSVNFPGSVSLILAGHWNNGQWRLPFIGPVYIPSGKLGLRGWMPGDDEVSGLATVYAVPQYISPGLGNSDAYPWWMPMRLFNRPQMTLLTLTKKLL